MRCCHAVSTASAIVTGKKSSSRHFTTALGLVTKLTPLHPTQTNLAGTGSESGMPEHLVCCHTPQTSQANILSPSSSLAPQRQSTVHLSVPLSILNLPRPFFPRHLPWTRTDSVDPIKSLTWVESSTPL